MSGILEGSFGQEGHIKVRFKEEPPQSVRSLTMNSLPVRRTFGTHDEGWSEFTVPLWDQMGLSHLEPDDDMGRTCTHCQSHPSPWLEL